ncbi:MAG: CDP-diacylglycerol--glycerol-3-phosphate 3-phosphatidyltransferase [Actinobacteria bacterium]|nr:MAG: CDP-diacylglycerol--glycerol-3-phosphate 3-phosphatidyltransferase [Actinomycetota bacterium]
MFTLNLPNLLTVVRILLVPVLVVALLENTTEADLLAAVVFAVASITDVLDGYLARARNWVTTFGKLMDPVADKLLVVAALLALVDRHKLMAWVAMVIIAREFAVTATRLAATQSGVVVAAKFSGKIKTAIQVATIFLLIAVSGSRPLWLDVLVYAMVVVTVVSGVDYFFGLRRQLGQAQARRAETARS